jgi:hypothetical protein
MCIPLKRTSIITIRRQWGDKILHTMVRFGTRYLSLLLWDWIFVPGWRRKLCVPACASSSSHTPVHRKNPIASGQPQQRSSSGGGQWSTLEAWNKTALLVQPTADLGRRRVAVVAK